MKRIEVIILAACEILMFNITVGCGKTEFENNEVQIISEIQLNETERNALTICFAEDKENIRIGKLNEREKRLLDSVQVLEIYIYEAYPDAKWTISFVIAADPLFPTGQNYDAYYVVIEGETPVRQIDVMESSGNYEVIRDLESFAE